MNLSRILVLDDEKRIIRLLNAQLTAMAVLAVPTFESVRQPGRPRSRANDQNTRDVDAKMPTVAANASMNIMLDSPAAPLIEPVIL